MLLQLSLVFYAGFNGDPYRRAFKAVSRPLVQYLSNVPDAALENFKHRSTAETTKESL